MVRVGSSHNRVSCSGSIELGADCGHRQQPDRDEEQPVAERPVVADRGRDARRSDHQARDGRSDAHDVHDERGAERVTHQGL